MWSSHIVWTVRAIFSEAIYFAPANCLSPRDLYYRKIKILAVPMESMGAASSFQPSQDIRRNQVS